MDFDSSLNRRKSSRNLDESDTERSREKLKFIDPIHFSDKRVKAFVCNKKDKNNDLIELSAEDAVNSRYKKSSIERDSQNL